MTESAERPTVNVEDVLKREARASESPGARIRRSLDRYFHPVSSAREEQFAKIAAALPEGEWKTLYTDLGPKLREKYRGYDRYFAISDLLFRAVAVPGGAALAAISPSMGVPGMYLVGGTGIGLAASAFAPGEIGTIRRTVKSETDDILHALAASGVRPDSMDTGMTRTPETITRDILLGRPLSSEIPMYRMRVPAVLPRG